MPINRMKPVKSVVAGKELAPVKSVVSRTPEERMALIDKQMNAITAQMRRMKVASWVFLSAGVLLTVGIGALYWWQTGIIVFWELPLAFLGAAMFAGCAKISGDLGNELRALAQEKRNLAKEFPDSPYFHGKVEVP